MPSSNYERGVSMLVTYCCANLRGQEGLFKAFVKQALRRIGKIR